MGAQHAWAALEGAACGHCEALPIRVLRSRLAIFDEAGQARASRGSGRRLRLWGSQRELADATETASALSQFSSDSSDPLLPRAEARLAASSARVEDPVLQLSDSEELDVLSVGERGF